MTTSCGLFGSVLRNARLSPVRGSSTVKLQHTPTAPCMRNRERCKTNVSKYRKDSVPFLAFAVTELLYLRRWGSLLRSHSFSSLSLSLSLYTKS